MNIYQRLNEVRKTVAYLQKDKKVEGKGYMAITHDAVTAAVRDPFIEHGVMVVPNLIKSAMLDSGTVTGKGNPILRYEATYRIAFVNIEEPADRCEVDMEAHALDDGDKAPGKAISYATKYAFLKLLSIETGLDDEAREIAKPKPVETTSHSAPKLAWEMVTADQRKKLAIIAETMKEHLAECEDVTAFSLVAANNLDPDEYAAIWSQFDSKQRSALKKAGEFVKTQAAAKVPA